MKLSQREQLDQNIAQAISAWNERYEGMDGMASSHVNKLIKTYANGYMSLDELRWTQRELQRISYIQLTAANPYPSTYAATLRLHRLAEEVIEAMRARLHYLEGILNG